MKTVLTVVSDFGNYARGQQITDEAKVVEILESGQQHCVVKSEVPDAPATERTADADEMHPAE